MAGLLFARRLLYGIAAVEPTSVAGALLRDLGVAAAGAVFGPEGGGDAVFDDLAVDVGAGAGGAGEVVGVVDGDEAEAGGEAFGPFEVVEVRPVEVGVDGDVVLVDGSPDFAQVSDEEGLAEVVVGGGVGEAVFEDLDGFAIAAVGFDEDVAESFGVDGPAEVAAGFFGVGGVVGVDGGFGDGIEVHFDEEAAVVVDANVVLGAGEVGDVDSVVGVGHGIGAGFDGVEHVIDEGLFDKSGGDAVEGVVVAPGFEGAGVLGDADAGGFAAAGGVGVDGMVGDGMGFEQAVHDGGGVDGCGAAFEGGKMPSR
jgi:hypothetical protein